MADNFSVTGNGGTSLTIASKDLGGGVQAAKHVIVDTSGNTMPAGDTNAHEVFVGLADGSHGPVACKASGTRAATTDVALVVRPLMPTNGTQDLPSGDAAARSIYVTPNDGTNAVTVKAASTAAALTDTSLVVAPLPTSDGTHTTPVGDAQARKISVGPGDGTNAFLSASLANLQAYTGTNAQLVAEPGELIATASIVTGTTTPDAQLAAPGSGKIYNVHTISVSLACTVDQVPLLFKLVQDAGGTPVTLWQGTLSGLAKTCSSISLTGLSIPQTVANKTLDLSVITGTIASTNYITCTIGASICA